MAARLRPAHSLYSDSMRVILVNWARIWDGAGIGGGVNGYAQALALELVDQGHEVYWICSGQTHIGGQPLHARRHPDWLGVRVVEIINSPVMSPSIVQFKGPDAEASSPELESLFARMIEWIEPAVVHFHNIEGLSAGCVAVARAAGGTRGGSPAVVYSLHNYHTICPQVYLLRGHRTLCTDARGGLACEGCIPTPDLEDTRATREAEWSPPAKETPTIKAVGADISALFRGTAPTRHPPGETIEGFGDLSRPASMEASADTRGRTARVLAERGPLSERARPLPVLNDVVRDPSIGSPVNAYGFRRRAMVDALNACDAVLAVSEFVNRKFASMGVRPELLRTQHIGTTLNRIVERRRALAFAPPPFDAVSPRPIRMLFMGVNHWYKGLPFFLDTLETLEPEVLSRFHLSIYAQGADQTEWMVRRLEPRLAGVKVQYGYDQADIPWMLGGQDLGVVPSVWWDNAPQTVFEFFACSVPVLAAAVGGIPDFVSHGVNGLLFRGNDAEDLAAQLRRLAADPSMLTAMRRNVRPPKDIGEHARELVSVYSECARARGRSSVTVVESSPIAQRGQPGATC